MNQKLNKIWSVQILMMMFMVLYYVAFTQESTVGFSSTSVIHHRGFEDFSQGVISDGGANMYVSKKGVIQLIAQWDINNDGHMDVLFNQDHNNLESVDAFIYWGTDQGFHSLFPPFHKELPAYSLIREIEKRKRHMTFLPAFGGGPVDLRDLNNDGYIDIVFPNTIHNYSVHMEAYIYWGGPDGFSPTSRTELPTLFASSMTVEDLNLDGYLDLTFANFGNEGGSRWGYKNHLVSYIYWGGAEGFSIERRSSIPSVSANACTAGDFNGDGWPDLVFANNNLKHQSLYVYLGGKTGFSPKKRMVLEGGDPAGLQAGDLNGDNFDDLIVNSNGKGTMIYYGASDFDLNDPEELPTQSAKDVELADFNRDGFIDLVFANQIQAEIARGPGEGLVFDPEVETESEIYWGSEAGFRPESRLRLPTLFPKSVVTADLNGDRYQDIVFANEHDGQTFDVPSYIYWGHPDGFNASNRSNLQGFGSVGIAVADLDNNGNPDVVLMNQISGAKGNIPSVIFWGNSAHVFSETDATLLEAENPYHSRIADLNDDGYPDVAFTGSPASIFYGSEIGFQKHVKLEIDALGISVADYNKDGFLDIAYLVWSGDPGRRNYAHILWGSEVEYSTKNSNEVPFKAYRGGTGISSADLDKDGYLDLIVPCMETPNKLSEIVWGCPKGFGERESTLLKTDGVGAPALADLDENGWLDIVFPGNMNLDTQDTHSKSLIYWGGQSGFSDTERVELEAYGSEELHIADLNLDGHLDIVAGNYKATDTRSLPIFIYWGNVTTQVV